VKNLYIGKITVGGEYYREEHFSISALCVKLSYVLYGNIKEYVRVIKRRKSKVDSRVS
jgi:hypothetical protein